MRSKVLAVTEVIGTKFIGMMISFCFLMGLLVSSNAVAQAPNNDSLWFVNILKTNNGRAFCLPATMTVSDAVKLLQQYSNAHPELRDQINDAQTIRIFAEAYPCIAMRATPQTFTMSATPAQRQVQVVPQGEYAEIDTKPAIEAIRSLRATVGNENDDLISEIENNSANYAPPVFFALASVLYKQGKSDDAIFWFNAGHLRANFDAARCTDISAKAAVPALAAQVPPQLRRSQFDDPAKLRAIIHRVVQWDEDTAYNYDFRWINLHGIDAIRSSMGATDVAIKPLSLPREQWAELAQKTRADYLRDLDGAIAVYEKQKSQN